MTDIRHEKYDTFIKEAPFTLAIDLKRTPLICSRHSNRHENIEIQLCTDGSGTVIINGTKYEIIKGDIIAVSSGNVHCTSTESFLQYTCLIVSTQWCKQMDIDYEELCFRPHIRDSELEKLIYDLSKVYSDCNGRLRIARLNEILLKIMIRLTENYSVNASAAKENDKKYEVIKKTLIYIEKSFDKKLSLSEIAKTMYIDKYTLCKEFKRYTGQTIIEYQHRYRCEKALDFLSKGLTVTEAASLCGFDNLSFFTKVFRKYVGKKPSECKR